MTHTAGATDNYFVRARVLVQFPPGACCALRRAEMKHLCAEGKIAARASRLTTIPWQPPPYDRHCPFCSLLSVLFFIWHQDIRARRIWVHDTICGRQKIQFFNSERSEHLYKKRRRAQKKRTLGLFSGRPLLIWNNWKEKLLLRRKKWYVDTGPYFITGYKHPSWTHIEFE